jgi:hypothetical protein
MGCGFDREASRRVACGALQSARRTGTSVTSITSFRSIPTGLHAQQRPARWAPEMVSKTRSSARRCGKTRPGGSPPCSPEIPTEVGRPRAARTAVVSAPTSASNPEQVESGIHRRRGPAKGLQRDNPQVVSREIVGANEEVGVPRSGRRPQARGARSSCRRYARSSHPRPASNVCTPALAAHSSGTITSGILDLRVDGDAGGDHLGRGWRSPGSGSRRSRGT